MPKPLFYIRCTTCESRLGIHDKNLVGQIVSCPKCQGMVLVELPGKNAVAPPVTAAVAVAPPAPAQEKHSDVTDAVAEPSQQELSRDLNLPADAPVDVPADVPVEASGNTPAAPPLPPAGQVPVSEAVPEVVPEVAADDDLSTLLQKRAELSTGELVLRMLGVGVGVFILLLLLGTLLSSVFSGKSEPKTPPEGEPVAVLPLKIPEMVDDDDQQEQQQAETPQAGARVPEVKPEVSPDEAPDAHAAEELDPWAALDDPEDERVTPAPATADQPGFLSDWGRDIFQGEKPETPDFTEEETEGNVDEAAGEEPEPYAEEEAAQTSDFIARPEGAHYSPSVRRIHTPSAAPAHPAAVPAEEGGTDSPPRAVSPAEGEIPPLPPEDSVFITLPKAPEGEHLSADALRKLSLGVKKMEVSGAALSAVLRFVEQASGLKVVTDWTALQTQGVQATSPVEFELEETTLRDALDEAVRAYDLGYIMVGSNLKIVGADAMRVAREAAVLNEKVTRVMIPVDDLVSSGKSASVQGKSGIHGLMTYIQTFVAPGTWQKNGGRGRILTPGAGKIQVEQYPSVIQEVHVFCDKLRLARNIPLRGSESKEQLAARVQAGDGPKQITILSPFIQSEPVCKKPVTCDLSHSPPLGEAVLRIAHAAGAKIVLDEQAIRAVPVSAAVLDADIPDMDGKLDAAESLLDVPVTFHFQDFPFQSAMNAILERFPMLSCYPISEDTFILTTAEKAARARMLVFVRVDDVLSANMATTVVQDIRRTIRPESWGKKAGESGTGEIMYDDISGRFIIYQSPVAIHEIHEFLKTYRGKSGP